MMPFGTKRLSVLADCDFASALQLVQAGHKLLVFNRNEVKQSVSLAVLKLPDVLLNNACATFATLKRPVVLLNNVITGRRVFVTIVI